MADLSLGAHSALGNALALPFPLTRRAISDQIEALLEVLDRWDGDPDLEPAGDELDGDMSEDDFVRHSVWNAGPGCPISDSDYDMDEDFMRRARPSLNIVRVHESADVRLDTSDFKYG